MSQHDADSSRSESFLPLAPREKPDFRQTLRQFFRHFILVEYWRACGLRPDLENLISSSENGCCKITLSCGSTALISLVITGPLNLAAYFGLNAAFDDDHANVTGIEASDLDIMFHLPLSAAAFCSFLVIYQFVGGAKETEVKCATMSAALFKLFADLIAVLTGFFIVSSIGTPLLLNLISPIEQWAACASMTAVLAVLYTAALASNKHSHFAQSETTGRGDPRSIASFNIMGVAVGSGIAALTRAIPGEMSSDPIEMLGLCVARCLLISVPMTYLPQLSLMMSRLIRCKKWQGEPRIEGGAQAFSHLVRQLFNGGLPSASICALWHSLNLLSGPYGFPTGNHFIDSPDFSTYCIISSLFFAGLSYRNAGFKTGFAFRESEMRDSTPSV
jgi:hypothetical protein